MSNATTAEDLNSLTAATETQEAQPVDSAANTSEQSTQIPEKFVNKSPIEIIEAYNNLERHSSKISSERAEERKRAEALEVRIRDLESRPAPQPQYVQQTVERPAETDPYKEYEELFDNGNPKEAIKRLVNQTKASITAQMQQRQMMDEQQAGTAYHIKQKTENPEYAKLEPTMQQLAVEYQDLVRADKAGSKKVLELLALAAKGAKSADIASEAASKAKKEQQAVKEEKRQAFSESTGTKGDNKVSFKDLSVDQMEKALGIDRTNRG